MKRKHKESIAEIESQIDVIRKNIDIIRNDIYGDEFISRVSYALQRILDTNQTISITHYVNDKEITTKLIRDELAELRQDESELSILLDNIKEMKKKYDRRK